MKNKITFILLSLFLLNPTLGYSYQGEVFTSSSLTPIEQKSAKAIWKIIIPESISVAIGGTGFFISKNEFITNFHIASALTQNNIEDSYLTQEGNSHELQIKEIIYLSAQHDLAVLEIEGKVSDYLNISKEIPQPNENLVLIGYPDGQFSLIKKTRDILSYHKSNHSFFSDHSDLSGASGSPLLNSKGEVVGVFYFADLNLAYATKAIYLKNLLNEEIKSFETPEDHIAYAIEQLTKAANQGLATAQFHLGLFYSKGKGVEQNFNQALNWYQKAAKQGHATAQFELGSLYYYGEGVEQDYKEAFNWMQKTAKQGHAGAQYNLGLSYYYGEGVEQNLNQSFHWTEKAAKQGLATAQYHLSALYYKGKGVEQDINQSFNWTKEAAKQGDAEAQYNLGLFYHTGQVVEQDYKEAFNWTKEAAEQGYAEAQFELGWFYEKGVGTEKDLGGAIYWYKKAAEQDHHLAKAHVKRLSTIK